MAAFMTKVALTPMEQPMKTNDVFKFTLIFRLPQNAPTAEQLLDALFEAGCDDALVGMGRAGYLGLDFEREAKNADTAVDSAMRNVAAAIPGAKLVEAKPDLVSATEVAELTGCSRQNIRKHLSDKADAPAPAYFGGGVALWHLSALLPWLEKYTQLRVEETIARAAQAVMRANLAIQEQNLKQRNSA
jgi:predicted DNA-binding transcriptional regulator AlpA